MTISGQVQWDGSGRISIGPDAPGPLNAITDVPGVQVGHATVIADAPVVARTGITFVQPVPAPSWEQHVFAGYHRYNGFGEVSGLQWLDETGVLNSPIGLTGTFSLGMVRDTVLRLTTLAGPKRRFQIPVIGETNDFLLSDGPAGPLRPEHVEQALANLRTGPVAEGNVGAGTGVVGYLVKGGIGTASKIANTAYGQFTVGALVQTNHGRREDLRFDGLNVGDHIGADKVPFPRLSPDDPYIQLPPFMRPSDAESGSVQIVIATDAPLIPIQCRRLAQRAIVGLGRVGGTGNNGSGDFAIAFATGNLLPGQPTNIIRQLNMIPNEAISPLFAATIAAVESAVLNALIAAETITGRGGNTVWALPADLLADTVARCRGRDSAG
ncbi:P1 family peptidase [Sphingosinicella microcystinivorans]|uniref:D-aminopeptidase n=1 Tax=Sphingosinicella microcystinivorans TaxID=335406 RepID=A0AAD1D4Q0_SPHMI|nr:P1 family peptidase [Sphingosinicella microcystinivorans]RKS85446.1 L-aminopeptidase DmpA [Sphingosinicella microcystinivorans]BBE33264.1 D-aminopeptidase [Sphingosinicella microcystinivorans]